MDVKNKKLFDEVFKEVWKEIFAGICHLEVEYEIAGQPKRIDFYMEETHTPINNEMDYLKVFSRDLQNGWVSHGTAVFGGDFRTTAGRQKRGGKTTALSGKK